MQAVVDSYPSAKSAAFVVRSVRPALKWAAAPGRLYAATELTQLCPPAEGAVERRKRILSQDELTKLLPALRASERPYGVAMLFMLLTLCRREEACSARWRDVDCHVGTWTISKTKNDQPHVVPLPRQALDLLRNRRPAKLDLNALVFRTRAGGPLGNWDRETKRLILASGLGRKEPKSGAVVMNDGSSIPTRHDLRRTGATMLGEMGELPDIIEAALNHVSIRSPLAATYNRSRYRPQVAAALQRLADTLDGIEAGAAKVVALRAGA